MLNTKELVLPGLLFLVLLVLGSLWQSSQDQQPQELAVALTRIRTQVSEVGANVDRISQTIAALDDRASAAETLAARDKATTDR